MEAKITMKRTRKNTRIVGFDYSSAGQYFVTICTTDRNCIFGKIIDGVMVLNELGTVADQYWRSIEDHTPHVGCDRHVVMPNHVHGLLELLTAEHGANPKLGTVVGSFKSAVAKQINLLRGTPGAPVWQRGFYEQIVATESEANRIRQYIRENPKRWKKQTS